MKVTIDIDDKSNSEITKIVNNVLQKEISDIVKSFNLSGRIVNEASKKAYDQLRKYESNGKLLDMVAKKVSSDIDVQKIIDNLEFDRDLIMDMVSTKLAKMMFEKLKN